MVIGCILFAPIFAALCSDSLTLVGISLIYGFVLWHSPKFSTRIKRFWRKFWRLQIELLNEVR